MLLIINIDNKTTLSLKDLHTKQNVSNAQTKHQNEM